jgi:chromosome segregation protein
MMLKRLNLAGFKTFADKTEIEFGEGMTAVVGPNGCGKSNVADALLWVMGEQNPRLLRGAEGRDVIFSGTDKRRQLGMAEVRLTVDNEDRSLPVEYSEVTVTRRVYRSGESYFAINNTACRLKDIVELFLDTGVGKGAYSFVTQTEIDAVLSAKAEDRRELFEEAAGIKKYRVKKREAVRKLEQAEGHLTRVRDIVHELEQQREPLCRQAEQARRYLELTARLQQIEIDLLVAEAQKADYELYAASRDRELATGAIDALSQEITEGETEADLLRSELAAADASLEEAAAERARRRSAVERAESRLQVAIERGKGAEQSAEALDGELKELAGRIAGLVREEEQFVQASGKAETAEAEKRQALHTARGRLAELEKALAAANRLGQDRQGAIRRLSEERSKRESALAACTGRLQETEDRLVRLRTEREALEARAAEAATRLQTARQAAESLTQARTAADQARTAAAADRRAQQDVHAQSRLALDAARRKLAERESRLATLRELQQSGEGFYQGVRALLTAVRKGALKGAYLPVVDLFSVPEGLRVAVEVALGGSAQDVVCETEREARDAIEWLKRERAGRATFLALPMLRPSTALEVRDRPVGFLGVAADLVGFEPKHDPVARLLLGRVAVFESMESAIAASRRMQGWSRIVTLEGELITPGGAMTGGSLQGRGAHLVGRKGEIDDLSRAIPGIRAEAEAAANSIDACASRVAAAERALDAAGVAHSQSQAQLAAAESDVRSAEREDTRVRAELADFGAEVTRLTNARQTLAREADEWTAALAAHREQDTNLDDALGAAQAEAQRLSDERDTARSDAVGLEVEVGRTAEKRSGLRRSLAAAQEGLRQARASQAAKQTAREMAGGRYASSEEEQRAILIEREEAQRLGADADAAWDAARSHRAGLAQQSAEAGTALRAATAKREELRRDLHDAELRFARMEVRLAQTSERLMEEYSIEIKDALARPDPGPMERNVVNEVARLRREVRSMGQVNTGAVEEYDRLSERCAFLVEQRGDLEKARESLLGTITEIDDSTRGVFMETFEAVTTEFALLFERLFGGGSTRLTLSNPDDVLETGIEVFAQPPGKKPQHLSLLSGGERALTATALLFAFMAVRPSPFVVLDEVDAPLDGPNVEKFVKLVADFSDRTQFLVITHNPVTMEHAPRWYGVTMQEAGVSRVLSYRVPSDTLESEPEEPILPA